MPFEFKKLEIPEIILIKPKVFEDDRGFFLESFKETDFEKVGIPNEFIQDNHSKSNKNVLRGLHYQKNPNAQGKLVRCTKGRLIDIAVDIRKGSPTYGKYIKVELSQKNKLILWVPKGFAHGILTLEEGTEIQYKASGEYSPEDDRGILWNDPKLNINWGVSKPILSEKDKKHPTLEEADNNFKY